MPRFRLRTLLILTAVVATCFRQWQRASALLRQAAANDEKATEFYWDYLAMTCNDPDLIRQPAFISRLSACASWN
jgi:hypothetical protein